MKNLILTLIITLPLTVLGQGWEQMYDNGIGTSVVECYDSGFFVGGQFEGLMKLTNNGDIEWFNDLNILIIRIKKVSNNKYGVLGRGSNGSLEFKLLDENGLQIWSTTLGFVNDNLHQMEFTEDLNNDFLIVSLGTGKSEVKLYKLNQEGEPIFDISFENVVNEDGGGCTIINDYENNYIIGFTNLTVDEYGDFYLIKTNENGELIWEKNYNKQDNQFLFSIVEGEDNTILMTGFTDTVSCGGYNNEIYFLKVSSDGDIINESILYHDSCLYEKGVLIKKYEDNFMVGGWFQTDVNHTDFLLLLINENGEVIDENIYGDLSIDEHLIDFNPTSGGGFIMSGFSYDYENDFDVSIIIKTDGNGNTTSTFEIPLPNPDRKLEKIINLKGQEIKPQTGQPIIEIFDDGSVKKKIIIEK